MTRPVDSTGTHGSARLPRPRLADLQARLSARADERSRQGWERYLRGSTPFRGVPTAAIRTELHAWLHGHEHGDAESGAQGRRKGNAARTFDPGPEAGPGAADRVTAETRVPEEAA